MSPFSGGLPWIAWPAENTPCTNSKLNSPENSLIQALRLVLAVLSRLTAEGLQSDERYTESRIRYRLERGFGYHHIRNDLINKGVDPYLVDQMLHPDDDCWLLKARELIEKKLFLTEDVPHRVLAFAGPEHKKLARFLEARGFSQRDIRVALDAVIAP